MEFLSQPWPWYVAGPLLGLMVPILLISGGKSFGISSSLRHICAATVPANIEFLKYDWKKVGLWNLVFALGMIIGGAIAATVLASPDPVIAINPDTTAELRELGISDFTGLVPSEFISWSGLASLPGIIMVVGGGFLVGFGARYAGGCTSGHAVMGLSNLQVPSLVAVAGFFIGGLIVTHMLLPYLI